MKVMKKPYLEELPDKARAKLPPSAQRMFLETLRNARLATSTEGEAEKMAWEAVRRKYGPRDGIRLWVRHDWQRTAQTRPGDTTAKSSSQRRIAKAVRRKRGAKEAPASPTSAPRRRPPFSSGD